MATNFDANQYEGVFVSHKLQNWEVPKQYKGTPWFNDHFCAGRPKSHEGFTEVIATDRGHITQGHPRSGKNPWGDFIGTWDLPKKIPGNHATVTTARRSGTQDQLQRHLAESQKVMTGKCKNTCRQMKGAPAPIDVPAGAHASHLLESEKCPSPVDDYLAPQTMTSPVERRSGAEAPVPDSTSPGKVASPSAYSPKPASQQSMRYEKINAL